MIPRKRLIAYMPFLQIGGRGLVGTGVVVTATVDVISAETTTRPAMTVTVGARKFMTVTVGARKFMTVTVGARS